MNLARLCRDEVCYVNKMLPATGLVTMHSGNASGLDRAAGRLVIKPSGVDYDKLTPEDLVEVDLETGDVVDSKLRPSVDLPHHLFLYRNMPERGRHHPHAQQLRHGLGRRGPADPGLPDGDRRPVRRGDPLHALRGQRRRPHRPGDPQAPQPLAGDPAGQPRRVRLGRHAADALKAAVMTEDVAKTVHLAMQLGQPRDSRPTKRRNGTTATTTVRAE